MTMSMWPKLIAALGFAVLSQAGFADEALPATPASSTVSEQVRAELVAARDAVWRGFFSEDPARLNQRLAPGLIAIQESEEAWGNREQLVKLAGDMQRRHVRLVRIEFPKTEIQLFGDVAVMYYTYVFETAQGDQSATDAGRGTEIFVRRSGQWIDAGWHLDNGAFARRGNTWTRVGNPVPGQTDQKG